MSEDRSYLTNSCEFRIPLTKGCWTIVDGEDYEVLSGFKWCVGFSRNKPYALRVIDRKNVRMHRIIMNPPRGVWVDHINGDTLDNRRVNLRFCTRSENQRNRPKQLNNETGFKGLCVDRRGPAISYSSKIYVNGKIVYLGWFSDPVLAAQAYDRAALKYFGDFAWTNFPKETYLNG